MVGNINVPQSLTKLFELKDNSNGLRLFLIDLVARINTLETSNADLIARIKVLESGN